MYTMIILLLFTHSKNLFFALISYSMKEYEERAVSLALNRPKLQALGNKLKAARLNCPLFDTARWVCQLIFVFEVVKFDIYG